MNFSIHDFFYANSQVNYIKQFSSISDEEWGQIISSGKLSQEFIDEFLVKLIEISNKLRFPINQKLSEQTILNLIANDYRRNLFYQFRNYNFQELFIRRVIDELKQRMMCIGLFLESILLGTSSLSKQFYIDYSEFLYDDVTNRFEKELRLFNVISEKGTKLPFEFFSQQLSRISLDDEMADMLREVTSLTMQDIESLRLAKKLRN